MSEEGVLPEILMKYFPEVNFTLDVGEFSAFAKDNKEADRLRSEGNKLFEGANYSSALETYSKSIAIAEFRTSSMALAYCNRASALFKRKLYKECLTDIDRAVQNGYLEVKIARMRAKAHSLKDGQEEPSIDLIPEIPVDKKNPTIQCAIDCVAIREFKGMGRGIVATRDIQLGEVLAVENPFAVALFDMTWMYCHECAKICFNTIPCETCSTAMFCGEDCKETAWQMYHQYECKILPAFSHDDKKKIQLALRIALSIKDYQSLFKSEDSIYKSDRAYELLKLCAISGDCDIPKIDGIALAAKICALLTNHTTFFTQFESTQNQLIFKALLLHIIFVTWSNSFDFNSHSRQLIGRTMYTFLSLLNHSCVPNGLAVMKNSATLLFAIENIKKGEQIFISYIDTYDAAPKSTRQMELKQYCFTCRCEACAGDWPTVNELEPSDEDRLRSLLEMQEKLKEISPEMLKKEEDRLRCLFEMEDKVKGLITNALLGDEVRLESISTIEQKLKDMKLDTLENSEDMMNNVLRIVERLNEVNPSRLKKELGRMSSWVKPSKEYQVFRDIVKTIVRGQKIDVE